MYTAISHNVVIAERRYDDRLGPWIEVLLIRVSHL